MLRGRKGETRELYALIVASTPQGYDRVLVYPSRDGDSVLANLGVREWSDWWIDSFTIDGDPVEGYVRTKLINLSATADSFELFFPQIWPRYAYTQPEEISRELDREVGNFLQNPSRDALGVIDDETYHELLEFHHGRIADVAEYLCRTREWDVLFAETHASDYASHFFLPQADEISGAPEHTLKRCREGLEATYASIDGMIGRLANLADEDTVIAVVSDHGGTPSQYKAIDVNQVLEEARDS